MNIRLNRTLLASAAVLMTPATPLFAQSLNPDATQSPGNVGAQASDEIGVTDIVVTAQRRAENLQKSSLAISVVSQDALAQAGVTSATALTEVLPGVQVATGGPIPQIYIRGIGDFSGTSINNPSIALNVAGVYSARPAAAAGTFFDLDRLEVLKGPQGTLYGRNASGGAINIIPARPRLDRIGGAINLEVANFRSILADGAINLPVSDQLALRGAFQLSHRDGYLSDGGNDDIHQSVRLQALWQPSADVSLLLYGSYYHAGGVGPGYALYDPAGNPLGSPPRPPIAKFDPWTSTTDPRAAAILAATAPPPIFRPGDPDDLYQNNRFWNAQAELTVDLGFATLTALPAYQHATQDYRIFPAIDFQSRNQEGPETSETYSAEVRLSHVSDDLKWVVGGFYYHEDQVARNSLNNGFVQNIEVFYRVNTRSLAGFGEATYSLTDRLRVIGGLRYTQDRRAVLDGRDTDTNAGGITYSTFGGRATQSKLDYRAGLEFDVGPQNMLFATVATGFKSGGPQNNTSPAFKPETLRAYELGSRNRFFDNRLQVNVELFYLSYRNQQIQVIGPDAEGTIAAVIQNAGSARSYGADIDVIAKPTSHDTLSLNLEFNPTRYTSFVYEQPIFFIANGIMGCPITPTGEIGVVGPIGRVDCSGRDLIRAPRWSGSATYMHSFDLGAGSTLDVQGDFKFASRRELSSFFIANSVGRSYQTLNASITYSAKDSGLRITGFVRNITNEAVYTGVVLSNFAPGLAGGSISPPRTYGVRMGYRF